MADKTPRRIVICVVALCLPTLFLATPLAAQNATFDIRFADGKIAISADQIRSYDWATHTLTLAPTVREALVKQLRGQGQGGLVSGIPFAVTVRGTPIYTGVFKSSVSSIPSSKPVIVVDEQIVDPTLGEDRIRIARWYGTPGANLGDDPRGDARVRDALKSVGKLVGGLR